ncbi:lectin-like domain-containing protein [Vagococcus humatus]|uniref:WxL domain-containing protein n=2 Tax=Bacilli TaxID=91061 RepID=A0A3S0AEI7_9ENTE|nr:hypothetical protein [Vagococcus humatus]RST89829.1 hypothetical protein C7P63_01755 [Vagococcus humatus]
MIKINLLARFKQVGVGFLMLVTVFLVSLIGFSQPSLAAVTGSPTIPKGAITLGNLFAPPNGKITIETIQNSNENNGLPYSLLSLSGRGNWASIWANERYRMDFNQSFNGRMYINLGINQADGFAFVMHNDSNETKASTSSKGDPDGQNLGVYGRNASKYIDNVISKDEKYTPEDTAIQNSVAIEFDTYVNGTSGSAQFDVDPSISGKQLEVPHMAYAFPGNLNKSYKPLTVDNKDASDWFYTEWFKTKTRNARLVHEGYRKLNTVVGDNVQDGTWYEFRYNFDKNTHQFSYYLKNPVTNSQTTVVNIPWADLQSELKLAEHDNKAYWGFTVANGASAGETKFVFTQVPVDLGASLSNDVARESDDSVAVEEDAPLADKFLKAGEKGIFKSHFIVNEGEADIHISKWMGYLDPKYIQLTNNDSITNIQVVKNGQTNEPIGGTATVNPTTGEVQVTLSSPILLKVGEELNLHFQAKTHDSITTPVQTTFYSNLIGTEVGSQQANTFSSNPVYYWINKMNEPPVITQLVPDPKESFTDYTDTFGLKYSYEDLDAQINELTYQLLVNEKEVAKGVLEQPKATDISWQDQAPIDLLDPNTLYHLGENQMKLIVTDGSGASDTKISHFTVEGYQGFEELTTDYTWKYARSSLTSERESKARQAEMKIKPRDTRTKNSQTRVTMTMSDITDGQGKVMIPKEEFVFKQAGQEESLGEVQFQVNQSYTYDAANGLLLRLSNQDQPGLWQGTVTWNFIDAP